MTPAQMAAEVLRLETQTAGGPWTYDVLSGTVVSRIGTPDVEFVADMDTQGSENVTAEFIAYCGTAAPSIAAALLDALERERALVEALRKLGPALVFNHNIGGWPYWYCAVCGARHQSEHKVVHTPECAWNIVTAATAREDGTGE